MNHAPLPPSSARLWANCTGSTSMQSVIPEVETDAQREGVAAHWLVNQSLSTLKSTTTHYRPPSRYLGETDPDGTTIDDKAVHGATVMVDDVMRATSDHGGLSKLLIEHRVRMPSIHADNWGTLDCALFIKSKRLLILWDYKHGHRPVDAEDNLQCIDYLAGLYDYFAISGLDDQEISFEIRIVQPFSYSAGGPVSSWCGRLSDLRSTFNFLSTAASKVSRSPTLTAGEWCRDCRAVGVCSTARRMSYSVISYAGEAMDSDAMSPPDLAVERDILSIGLVVLKARHAEISDLLINAMQRGAVVPGLALGHGRGRLGWTVPDAQVKAFAQLFGVEVAKPTILTVSEAVKAAPSTSRAQFASAIPSITARSTGAIKIIDSKDTKGARAFGATTTQE